MKPVDVQEDATEEDHDGLYGLGGRDFRRRIRHGGSGACLDALWVD